MKTQIVFDPEDSKEPIVLDLPQEPRIGEEIVLEDGTSAEIERISYPAFTTDFVLIAHLFPIDAE